MDIDMDKLSEEEKEKLVEFLPVKLVFDMLVGFCPDFKAYRISLLDVPDHKDLRDPKRRKELQPLLDEIAACTGGKWVEQNGRFYLKIRVADYWRWRFYDPESGGDHQTILDLVKKDFEDCFPCEEDDYYDNSDYYYDDMDYYDNDYDYDDDYGNDYDDDKQ
jgi:hypothetical protein